MTYLWQPIISPLLVGREPEREYLRQALDAARQGRGSVALLAGEAGVGKSRLAEEARRLAVADGFDVRIGHCFEDDVGFAYAPLIDALRTWLAPLPESAVPILFGARAAEIIKLLPELAHTIPDLQPTAPLDAEAEKRRLIESLYRVLVQSTLLPEPTPLLLIMEDLHWSDESSLDFLYLLARRAMQLPLVVICTYRREESTSHFDLWLARLTRERLAHELALKLLSRDEVSAMVQAIVGPGRSLAVEAVVQLHALTEGNPFLVEEVLKALVADGSDLLSEAGWTRKPPDEIRIPKNLQDAIYHRTSRLGVEASRVLALAAAAGRRFDFSLLQRITGYGDLMLLALIKELVAAQLVVEETADHFAFRHALTQQTVYNGLLARERAHLHWTIGTALEHLHTAAPGAQAANLSYHFYVAGDWGKALDYALQAGEQTQAICEPLAAVELWTRALAAADHLSQPQFAARARALRSRGWAYEMLGQFEQARSDYEAALRLARDEANGQAEWRTLLDLGSHWSAQDYVQAGAYFQQAIDLARRSGNSQMLAHSLNRVGNWHLNLDQPHTALRCHHEALVIFQDAEDCRGQAAALDFLGMASLNCGDLADSVRYFVQALALYQIQNDRAAISSIWANLTYFGGAYLLETLVVDPSPFSDEARIGEPALKLAREIGWRAGEAYALTTLGQTYGHRGDYGRAQAYAQEALAIAEAIEHREWMAAAHYALGRFNLDLLATDSALSHAMAALDLAQRAGSGIWCRMSSALLATIHLARGEPKEAEAVLDSVAGREGAPYTLMDCICRLARARLELMTGKPARALQVVDDLIATTPNSKGLDIHFPPALLLMRADTLVALGQEAKAEALLHTARAGADVQTAARFLWRILGRQAMLYQGQGRHAEAETTVSRAREVIEQIASTIPEQVQRKAFVRRATQQLPEVTPRRIVRATRAANGLTTRETQVAELIAQGCSNREIATRLVITERTVTTHISHIFGKLGFRTRTQIAVWVDRQGLGQAGRITRVEASLAASAPDSNDQPTHPSATIS